MHLVGFVITIYYDARSHERQISAVRLGKMRKDSISTDKL